MLSQVNFSCKSSFIDVCFCSVAGSARLALFHLYPTTFAKRGFEDGVQSVQILSFFQIFYQDTVGEGKTTACVHINLNINIIRIEKFSAQIVKLLYNKLKLN